MLKWLISKMRRIAGGIKENMTAIIIAVSMALFSGGFSMLIWAYDKTVFYRDFANALVFLGVCALFLSLISLRRENRKDERIRNSLLKTIESIESEIKGLRVDIGGSSIRRNRNARKIKRSL